MVNELLQVNFNESHEPVISGRELHEFLEVKTAYKDWFPRMCDYGFEEGTDFCSILSESTGGRPSTDHAIKLDMAKELAMLQRTERGKQARQYFIQVEKDYNSPEKIMARALQIAQKELMTLRLENQVKDQQIAELQPKADYFDELVDRNTLTNFRDTAKLLGVKQKKFIQFLIDNEYVFRDRKNNLKPYASEKCTGLFEIKECLNERNAWSGVQTLITPRGVETFRLLCRKGEKGGRINERLRFN